MGAIISFLLGNPMVILGLLGVFTFTSIAGDARAWWKERQAVKPFIVAIAEHKEAAEVKEAILKNALEANEHAQEYIEALQAKQEEDAKARTAAGAVDCSWSDDDLRLLNSSGVKRSSRRAR